MSCGNLLRAEGAAIQPGEPIPNYLAFSILSTLFCCLPLGIPAIVYARQVNGLAAAGNVQGARDASAKAKMWCWISFGLGLAFALIYVAIVILATFAGVAAKH
ncbi:MAG TPA: CD225/dispanin family protein [Planctomycetaceae bacterium]|nr:CD225/dispanin family protein [Planctomycetaceae bacterium]